MFAKFMLATLAALALSPMVQAAQYPWYEVEIYIFERQTQTDEHWPDSPLELKTTNALDLLTPQVASDITGVSMAMGDCGNSNWNTIGTSSGDNSATSPQPPCHGLESAKTLVIPKVMPVNVLPKDEQSANLQTAILEGADKARFGEMIAKLQRQAGVQPLLHITWRQEMKPRRQAQPLHLFAGQDFATRFQANGLPISEQPLNQSSFDGFNNLMSPEKSAAVWQFDGLLNIYLSHYLYVETRFNLRQPGRKSISIEGQPATVMPYLYSLPMEQNRRIRSTEIHYFDHPAMGMILQVRRIQQSDDAESQEPELQETEADQPQTPAADTSPATNSIPPQTR